jgi:molybdate transport system ATP-binding protein
VKEKNLFRLLYQTNPEYIIVDNPLDHLDQESRKIITITLAISKKTQLILIVNRQNDLFPFKVKLKRQLICTTPNKTNN